MTQQDYVMKVREYDQLLADARCVLPRTSHVLRALEQERDRVIMLGNQRRAHGLAARGEPGGRRRARPRSDKRHVSTSQPGSEAA